MRQLSLSFGVFADYITIETNSAKPLKKSICKLLDNKQFKEDDLIIVLAGSFGVKHGVSYIEISHADSFKCK
jgi:pyruvate kinase